VKGRNLPVPVDNQLYDRLSKTWWDENSTLGLLRTKLGPVRFGYFRKILIERQQRDLQEIKVLDVGCGGGLLSEEFARLGCQVTGIDPSERSLGTARRHALLSNLQISYQRGTGEQIPFANASFDVVVCCDVLEHVNDVAQVVHEIARVLRPGGIFFYETINATFLSWLTVIKVAQEWRITRFFPPNLHDSKQFVKPRGLQFCMQRCCLENREMRGICFRGNLLIVIVGLFRYQRGSISLAEMANALHFREGRNTSVLYMGYALKRGIY
jgi:2-polyprenyl-6-hydroxyphenyl methylase / 3-demethylubiquinone-9 3-methyltransferase